MKKVSTAQKQAQKKYDIKTKTIAVKYTPANMNEYKAIMKHIKENEMSANGFIKGLIRTYLIENNLI